MPKNNTQEPQPLETPTVPKSYDACDMYDLASLAESDMAWMSVAITDIKKRIKQIKQDADSKSINIVGFYDLQNLINMYQYVAESHLNFYSDEEEAYKKELKANKKVVTL